MNQLADLAATFAYLSLLTVGGGLAAFPALKVLAVDTHHWLTFPELLHFYSLGQLAPGPNMMMVTAVGMSVAGAPGAVVALVCFIGPTALLTFSVGRLWTRIATWRWRPAIQHGLGSVSVGLVLAGGITMGRGAITDPLMAMIAVAVFLALFLTRVNPAVPILGSGALAYVAYLAGY